MSEPLRLLVRLAGLVLCLALAVPASSEAPATSEAASRPDSAAQAGSDDLNRRFLDPALEIEEWVDRFETEAREVYRARDEIVSAIGLRNGMAVADVGAGTGLFVPPFARAVGTAGRVYAVDISPRFLEHLRARTAEAGLSQVEVVAGTDSSIELPERSVDVVFLCDTYHHFSAPAASLASIREALRSGGSLVLVEFDRIPGKSSDFILEHVRADKATFQTEIEAAGFVLEREPEVEGLEENYVQVFRKR